jgi:hypothetical protein
MVISTLGWNSVGAVCGERAVSRTDHLGNATQAPVHPPKLGERDID